MSSSRWILRLIPSIVALVTASSARAQWTDVPVCTLPGDQDYVGICADGAGGAVIVWYDTRSNPGVYLSSDIYAQRIGPSGAIQWATNGVPVCTASGYQGEPHVVSDGGGGFIVIWTDARSAPTQIYAQRLNGSGQPQWAPDGIKVSSGPSSAGNIEVATDGAGGAIVSWHGFNSPRSVLAQRVTVAGTTWGADVPICNLLNSEIHPHITADGFGGCVVAWPDDRVAGQFDLYAQRLNASGVAQWTANGAPACSSHAVRHAVLLSRAPGEAILVWNDARGGNAQVYGQRLNSSGVAQWISDGVLLSTAVDGDAYGHDPALTEDGSDGAIVAWDDGYPTLQVHAQRVSGDGTPLWSSAGVVLWNSTTAAYVGPAVSDGNGGAIITWRDGNGNIYAQRVDAAGTPLWAAPAVALSALSGSKYAAKAVGGIGGGAIFTIQADDAAGGFDLYAGRVSQGGTVDVAMLDPRQPRALTIDALRPNPASGDWSVTLSLAGSEPATIELLDLQGRCRDRRTISGVNGGRVIVVFQHEAAFAAGVYFVRLTQAERSVSRRVCLLR